MSEEDEIKRLKSKLEAYNAKAPDFEALFGDEIPGEAYLRRVVQSKLSTFTAAPPLFESLFPELQQPALPIKKRSYSLWLWGMAAASVLAFLFLLPDNLVQPESKITLLEKKPANQLHPAKQAHHDRLTQAFELKKLVAPSLINVFKSTVDSTYTSDAQNTGKDSTIHEQIDKIKKSDYLSLSVESNSNLEDAYKRAKAAKKQPKKEKLLAGLKLTGANRLLAFINENQGNDPLQGSSSNYLKGLSALDGASSVSLRSVEVSKNEWDLPSNILSRTILESYQASYSVPINIGLSLTLPLNNLIEIQSGILYTYMSSKTEGVSGTSTFKLHRELHYMGIPLRLAITFFDQQKLRVYSAVGGSIEKGLVGNQVSEVVDESGNKSTWKGSQKVYGFQPTTSVELGISYELANSIQLYFEPGATYCFPADQPISSRTEEPFSFNLGLGLRYRFN